MNLQLALLLIGIVVILFVVLTSYDKLRTNRHFRDARKGLSPVVAFTKDVLDLIDHAIRPVARLDINPGPLLSRGVKRLLKAEYRGGARPDRKIDSEFYDSLESFEQAASMPIDVSYQAPKFDTDAEDADAALENSPQPANKESPSGIPSMPDARIDFIAHLPGRKSLPRDRALGIYKQNEYLLEKPRFLYGLRHIEGVWSNLESDPQNSQYTDLTLSIQLVDRNGAISESELNTFTQMGLKMADTLGRPLKHKMDFDEALNKARQVDDFLQMYDAIASINVISDGVAFPLAKLRKLAEGVGLMYGAMNIFHRKNAQALGCQHMFSMANLYEPGSFPEESHDVAVKGLTLFMHIPCTYQPSSVFVEMAKTAKRLAHDLGGRLTDQEGRSLTDMGMDAICMQIEDMEIGMEEFGIVPGSETALRLFNS